MLRNSQLCNGDIVRRRKEKVEVEEEEEEFDILKTKMNKGNCNIAKENKENTQRGQTKKEHVRIYGHWFHSFKNKF